MLPNRSSNAMFSCLAVYSFCACCSTFTTYFLFLIDFYIKIYIKQRHI